MSKTESTVVQPPADPTDFFDRATQSELARAIGEIDDIRKNLTAMLQTLDRTEAGLAGKFNAPDGPDLTPRERAFILGVAADSIKANASVVAGIASRINEKTSSVHALLDVLFNIQRAAKKKPPVDRRPE